MDGVREDHAMVNTVRPAAVAGRFYPGHPSALRREVERCRLEAVTGLEARAPKMLLAPHAGTVYSGPVAASAYATLAPWRDRIRRVVLLGPAHRIALRGLAAPTASRFATPLTDVTFNTCPAFLGSQMTSTSAGVTPPAAQSP